MKGLLGRAFALSLGVLSAACVETPPPRAARPEAREAAPPVLTQERVTQLVGEIAALRGLPQKAPVPVFVLEEDAFLAVLEERTTRAAAESEIEERKAFHLAFDLLPNGTGEGSSKQASSTREVLQEQVLGFYDHVRKQIIVRASRATTLAEAEKERGILAHEIEHALQDQHFGRADQKAVAKRSDDEQLAYMALLEGDAMLTMFAYLATERGVPMQRMVRRAADIMDDMPAERFAAGDGDGALARALPIMREQLLFRYHAGTSLAAELYRAGGLPLVNRMFQAPPISTEQVLHPEKYLAGEAPAEIPAPEAPAGSGSRVIGHGVVGELATRVVLERCTRAATQAAEGWGGDRYTLFANADQSVGLLWATAWDSEKDAGEFAAALGENPTCLRALSLGGTTIDGSVLVRRKGKNVAVVRGFAGQTAEEIAARLLDSPKAAKARPEPLSVALVPRAPLPKRERGYFLSNDYFSPYLGVTARVPLGMRATVELKESELHVSFPPSRATVSLSVSDMSTAPLFQEKLFGMVEKSLVRGSHGRGLFQAGGGPLMTPLGMANQRFWRVNETPVVVRSLMIPICGGTGSFVFIEIYNGADPTMRTLLDGFLGSFRWNTNVKPPVCEALDPR